MAGLDKRLTFLLDRHGRGALALFAGPDATAKLAAARALAGAARVELTTVGLAAITDRYRGETEAHINQLLSQAEASGSILFFDEADALFGKRTGVTDSHDKYGSVDGNSLLRKLTGCRSLVILAAEGDDLSAYLTRRLFATVCFPPED